MKKLMIAAMVFLIINSGTASAGFIKGLVKELAIHSVVNAVDQQGQEEAERKRQEELERQSQEESHTMLVVFVSIVLLVFVLSKTSQGEAKAAYDSKQQLGNKNTYKHQNEIDVLEEKKVALIALIEEQEKNKAALIALIEEQIALINRQIRQAQYKVQQAQQKIDQMKKKGFFGSLTDTLTGNSIAKEMNKIATLEKQILLWRKAVDSYRS